MRRNAIIYLIVLTCLLGLAMVSSMSGTVTAQMNPTDQQGTVDAAIDQLFQQTAQAREQTAQAATRVPITQTVAAAFNVQLTATTQAGISNPEVITAENASRIIEFKTLTYDSEN